MSIKGETPLRAIGGWIGTGLAVLVAGYASTAGATAITGAGSSFGAPIYGAWGEDAARDVNITLNYQTIGSGAGQNQARARTVDFGASDAPMSATALKDARLAQFPTVMGAIVPVINLPGIADNQLRLTGALVAQIYDGEITSWNDARIAAVNPGLALPDIPVAPVRRADGSGTTFVFTTYLSQSWPQWKAQEGAGTSIQWPVGEGARGNDGIAAAVRNTEGSIGYLEYAYAAGNHMVMARMRNSHGEDVAADNDSFEAAARSAKWEDDATRRVEILDAAGEGAWPIMSATYVLIPTDPTDRARGRAVRDFFVWAFERGDDTARKLQYVPLPQDVKAGIESFLKQE
ncbi:phosphate ABC transporter substrate-binding protein PstS [Gluconacetobacter entanii]|uniref:Phosphate-binding protein PstS n=1 Tax=Gluconacetobacter entanii TaxID=108528 RepID=A0ABT3K8B0_9PROT|nr:phosphate ABC transporter substrate-binding protein PstS [Gluconacetobacter entanii]MCW4591674.1 phosphate ABC transporter substrate-binding protein PstS [Gluconacetobacter entanii]MCW4595282.1 phosphate ABC transporter substrate-binding protein PstS [Gluconacetobacter entanii]NPC87733.1 phosphate ABC transporter substrate-binding protein PstS [Gluconacetobacter entanii]